MQAAFGPGSPVMGQAVERLSELYDRVASARPVAVGCREWSRCQERSVGPATPKAFVDSTYLSLLCRLAAYLSLGSTPARPRPQDLLEVVNGDHFVRDGIGNFLGEDFFTWPFLHISLGGQPPVAGDPALDLVRELFDSLAEFDLTHSAPGLLTGLYRAVALVEGPPTRPGPVLEALEETGLAQQPGLSLLDPDCGDGTLLAEAVGMIAASGLADGGHPIEVLMALPFRVMGMTTDPLAMTLARTNYLLALVELLRGPHPPVLVPVYLADAAVMPPSSTGPDGELTHTFPDAGGLTLPHQVASDPLYLDWLLERLPNYLRGAALRLRAQSEDVAVQEVLNAYYNYLVSPKARTPIPEPLTRSAADVMVEAARHLVEQYIHGDGLAPLFLAKNAPAPVFASSRGFDLVVSRGISRPALSHYLNDTGRTLPAGIDAVSGA